MAAYIVLDTEITDPAKYEEYRKHSTPITAKYGGKFLVRGGKVETLEGGWTPKRFVVIEFPSVARVKEWYNSPEYAEAKKLRHKAARSKMILVEGA